MKKQLRLLPIEAFPDLLFEYGRALAWINMAEFELNLLIKVKTKLIRADHEIVDNLLDDMMIGKKISLAQQFLSKKLISDLWELNNRRLLLAHGLSGQNMNTGELSIKHKKVEQQITKPYLEETTKKAQLVSEELEKELRIQVGS